MARFPPTTRGHKRELVTFELPGDPVPDGEGGFTYVWTSITPTGWYVRMQPATARDAETLSAGTVLTHVSHLVHGDYHPGVTTRARLIDHRGRVFQVTSAIDVDDRGREMELVADLQT